MKRWKRSLQSQCSCVKFHYYNMYYTECVTKTIAVLVVKATLVVVVVLVVGRLTILV